MLNKSPNHYWHITKVGFCFVTFGIGALSIASFIFPLIAITSTSKEVRLRRARYTIHLSWKLFVAIMSVSGAIKVTIKNSNILENIHSKIIVANHPSLIDIVIMISHIPQADCIVKGTLAQNFFMKNIVKQLYILNSNNFDQILQQCDKSLKNGNNLIVFPEATRTVPGQKSTVSRGTAHIAINSNCDILPITIKCSPPALLKNQKWYDLPNETINYELEIKEPLNIEDYSNQKDDRPIIARHLTEKIKLTLGLH